MLGAIIGDVVGSRWEGSGSKDPNFQWDTPYNVFTDDTLCTVSIARWLLDGGTANTPVNDNPQQSIRDLCGDHARRGFGGNMRMWLRSSNPTVQNSWGNGAVMRVSPVALWATSDEEAKRLAAASVYPTHVHPQSIEGAQAITWAIRHAFTHKDPQKLLSDASDLLEYGDLTTRTLESERAKHAFDITTAGTAPLAIVCACLSGGFEQSIRHAIAMGGDADTLAAVAGSIAEGLYGIPQECVNTLLNNPDFNHEPRLLDTLREFYSHPRVQSFYKQNASNLPLLKDSHHVKIQL